MGKNLKKKIIIISGINFFEGGPLHILKDNLKYANDCLSFDYEIIALVHKINLFNYSEFNKVSFIEFPKSRKSYLIRLYYEYYYFKKLSQKLKPYLWFSLHDITPNVNAEIRAVYCHNPTPFKTKSIKDLFFQHTIFFFSFFYKLIYRINIKKNDFVIVQQVWLKNEFINSFDLDINSLLVCYPDFKKKISTCLNENNEKKGIKTNFIFFYPALSRPFKNFEVIGEALKILEKSEITSLQVLITINGNENNYSKYIFNKYKHLKNLKFLGMLSFEEVNELYKVSDALLFPSTIETWGLPISEFKTFNKPIILSRLPYAFETIGQYDKALFFDPLNARELAEKMSSLINGNSVFDTTSPINEEILRGWDDLYNKILTK